VQLDASKQGYNDWKFNEKRLWIARLLCQLYLENALIVSVDESSIRHNNLKRWGWVLNYKKVCISSKNLL